MEISGVGRGFAVALETVPTIPAERATQDREVVRAVKALNGAEMFGQENQLTFQRDVRTKQMVIRIVNRDTDEVIAQIPEDYVLDLAKSVQPAL
jgi:uncharacterized FlaG/YvyC family protein